MKVTLSQTSRPLQYIAANDSTQIEVGANQDNPSKRTFRPMELILAGLASCSAIDIENILRKQRINFNNLRISATGTRADSTPAVFTKINLFIEIEGDVPEEKLKRAIQLTKDKYCSVSHMLREHVEITYSSKIKPYTT
ncbi:OsmC family protein [Parvicella tangerina]|uniref:OsmC family peroxiredoxin n=1 Tax=Parvicella tangerina TaxID=2829795 RepID=A0A916N9K0_9FLAO|nr:OsmC family protein [Parvicella tangerina]CAG5077335.1 hypothetical protein CRYO30217_00353 [Parvicella tangerina]